jgi:hypothetical protein
MAPTPTTIPVPAEVAEWFYASEPETQQRVQRHLAAMLGKPGALSPGETLGSKTLRVVQWLPEVPFDARTASATATANQACYQDDFYAWTQQTAALIRAGQWTALDQEALAEEVEDLGVSQYHAVSSDLYQVLIHLLKWRYQPSLRAEGHSWQDTIVEHRDRIDRLCTRKPSLRGQLHAMLVEEYPRARRRASLQTGLARATFPEQCPWEIEHVLDADFWPDTPSEPAHGEAVQT